MELLVVTSIIALLMSVLLPAVSAVRSRAKEVRCMVNMRNISFEFRLFADDSAYPDRGDSDNRTDGRFSFEDFVESQYGVDEFWTGGSGEPQQIQAGRAAAMCPAGVPELTRVPDRPCTKGAITPIDGVSYGFNARLLREAIRFRGRVRLAPALLDSDVLDHPQVPIVFDIDGRIAAERRKTPYFSAPPGPLKDPYSTGAYWYPSTRHRGRTNVAFTGGHVLTSERPEREPGWDWGYQPTPFPEN